MEGGQNSSSTTVEIFGNVYRIQGDADPAYIQELSKYLDTQMREIAKNSSTISLPQVAILAAMNIADELYKTKNDNSEKHSAIKEKAARMIRLIEDKLKSSQDEDHSYEQG